MAKQFSIRYKFLFVTTLLLLFCVSVYLLMASFFFKQDKTELVYDYNRSSVTTIASDINGFFKSAEDKLELASHFYSRKRSRDKNFINSIISKDESILFLGKSENFEKIDKDLYTNNVFLETYNYDKEHFKNLSSGNNSIPFDEIKNYGFAIWTIQKEGEPPILGFAKNVIQEDFRGKPINQFAILAYLKTDSILNSISTGRINTSYVVNASGELLLHPEMAGNKNYSISIPEKIKSSWSHSKIQTSVSNFQRNEEEVLMAYSKTFNGNIVVISEIESKKAFQVVHQLIYRSFLFGLIVLTLAFIAAVLFSRSLTKPIQTLLQGMKKVSKGDLSTQIHVKSKDEIKFLANSFNQMILDLKQSRDELEEINRDLEDKVKERTIELEKQNQAVKNAQEALIKTSRLAAVGEMAGRAAHEVLNPLTNILTRAENMQRKMDDHTNVQLFDEILEAWSEDYQTGGFDKLVENWKKPSEVDQKISLWDEDIKNIKSIRENSFGKQNGIKKDLEFLLREGQRINRIVQSMRGLSVVKNNIKSHSLNKAIEESVFIMADLASQYNVSIASEFNNQSFQANIDFDEFLQVMTNMLRNSIQAISEKNNTAGGEIKINVFEDNEETKITIFDNGVGISEVHQSQLFEKQFSTKPKEEGTGLGLNICRRFIRAFNGDIKLLKSIEGKETTFEISLPNQNKQRKLA